MPYMMNEEPEAKPTGGKLSRPVSGPPDRVTNALTRRFQALDAEPPLEFDWPRDVGVRDRRHASRIAHFVAVMSRWTDVTVHEEAGAGAAIEPAAADILARDSRLLAEIKQSEPGLVVGAMDGTRQQWTPIRRSAYTGEPPSEDSFVVPRADQPAAIKPADAGLYTSTAAIDGVSMWSAYLEYGGSSALPSPPYTWKLTHFEPISVAEITSATQWAEFVLAHPRRAGCLVYPDWATIAERFDAVHITLPTIAAAQGFALTTTDGTIAPAFWDVETTFWVKWRISSAELVDGPSS
jgi:hypothetical protein